MTNAKREDLLRKVRGLMAKANSTEHEGERQTFMAKADELMEKYAIEQWMLATGEEENKAIVKRQFDMSWWSQLGDLPHDCKSQVWHLFSTCAKHARCYVNANGIWTSGGVPVWGMESDLDYLDALFTDLFVQLFGKIRPSYDPKLSLGENVVVGKDAGMKWSQIAIWAGHPEWYDAYSKKMLDHGKLKREYLTALKAAGRSGERVSVHPHTYAYSFLSAFTVKIRERLGGMEKTTSQGRGTGADLVLRDIRLAAAEAAFGENPAWRKSTGMVRSGARSISDQGYASGGNAGANARITQKGARLGSQKQIG